MAVRERVGAAVARGVQPIARANRFVKHALTFHRGHGAAVQVLGVQLSQANLGDRGGFFLNVGVAFEALRMETQRLYPPPHECDFHCRAEALLPDLPAAWAIDETTRLDVLGEQLGAAFQRLIAWLDPIDSPAALLRSLPLDSGADLLLRARLRHATDDLDGARADLAAAAALFADRSGMSVAQLIRRYRLNKLR